METEFKLPELGEQIESGKVVNILVQVGDTIDIDQPILEVETDKALIEVPSTVKGTIKTIHLNAGEDAGVGQTILTVEGGQEDASEGNGAPAAEKEEEKPAGEAEKSSKEEAEKAPAAETEKPSKKEVTEEPAAEAEEPPKAEAAPREDSAGKKPSPAPERAPAPAAATETAPAPSAGEPAAAAPSVRRLAREIGVDINQVVGTGPRGRISAEDVKRHTRQLIEGIQTPRGTAPAAAAPAAVPMPDFSKWGEIETAEMDGIRRATTQGLSRAWSLIPHVTQCEKADITEAEAFRKKFGKPAEAAGGKLTVTAILLKIMAAALKSFPKFAASIDPAADQIIYKKYAHIGVAVDTEHGLLVPVIRDVDQKSLVEISVELTEKAERARQRKLTLDEMQGACISITNLGGFGGTYFTPIVNWPEVAILGVSRAQNEPVYIDGEFRPRLMLPLQVSYDHRLIDGADGIRFLRWIVDALENPLMMNL